MSGIGKVFILNKHSSFEMKKVWFILLILLLMPVVFAQQSVNRNPTSVSGTVTNSEQVFEKFVVKEHFLTRNEIKAYLDEQGHQFEVMANGIVANAFEEFEKLMNQKINKFMIKLVVGIFGIMIFSGSLWFFISYRLNQKKDKIHSLQDEIVVKKDVSEASVSEVTPTTKTEEKPVRKDLSKSKKDDSLIIEVETEESFDSEKKSQEKPVLSEKPVEKEINSEEVPKPLEEDDLFIQYVKSLKTAKDRKEVKQIKKKYLKDLKEQYNKIARF